MISIRLWVGEFWEISGERYCLEQVMGGGFLLLRSVRTGSPYQVLGTDGGATSPTMCWLKEQLAVGAVRRLDVSSGSPARMLASQQEESFDAVLAADPRALLRQLVLRGLDRLPSFSRSDEGLRRALASIWMAKPIQMAAYKPPAPSTVRNWLKDRGVVGLRQLWSMRTMTGKGARKSVLPPTIHRRIHRQAMRYWSDHSVSITDAYAGLYDKLNCINRRLERCGLASVPVPSYEALRIHIRRTECWETYAAKFGKKAADERFKACGQGLASNRALLLGAMDHTTLDCQIVVDVRGWRLLGRPTLTVLMDVHSRCIVGWVLSFEPPSLFAVMECIKRANRPKLHLLDERADYPELADIFGKFDEIVVDNGKEFVGTSFEAAMTDIGTTVRWAPVRSPTHKAQVERLFGTLNTMVHQKLPGGVFPPAQLRAWGLDPASEAVLTLEQAEGLIWRGIGDYHLKRHRVLGRSPVVAWDESVRSSGIQVISDERQLDKMAGAHQERSLSRSGVMLFNLHYHDPAITGPLLEKLSAREPVRGRPKGSARARVTVKYNPANLGEIHVWNPVDRIFATLPCTDDYAQGLSLWAHQRIAEWAAEGNRQDCASEAERRVAFRREIEAALPDRMLKKRRRTAARLMSSPGIAQLAGTRLRIASAMPRHDGMAPIVPMNAMAPSRTDEMEKPVRPGGSRRKAKSAAGNSAASRAIEPQTGSFPNFDEAGEDWEEFR